MEEINKAIDIIKAKAYEKGWETNVNPKIYGLNNKKSNWYSFFFHKDNKGRGMDASEKMLSNSRGLKHILKNLEVSLDE